MGGLHDIDVEAETLRRAAVQAGIACSVERRARAGGGEENWLRLDFRVASFLYARGRLYHWDCTRQAFGPHINGAAIAITTDKSETLDFLRAQGFSVPEGRLFGREGQDAAVAYASALGPDICVKPNLGSKGLYVYPRLRSQSAIRAAFRKAGRLDGGVLVERSLPGQVLRYFYIKPRIVAGTYKRNAHVVGDGNRSIAQLIDTLNASIRQEQSSPRQPVMPGPLTLRTLRDQKVGLDTILEPGRSVAISPLSNSSSGGESHSCPNSHPSYTGVALRACAAMPDLKIAALDMIVTDRTAAADGENNWILEVNGSPGFSHFLTPVTGKPKDVGALIVGFLARLGHGDQGHRPECR